MLHPSTLPRLLAALAPLLVLGALALWIQHAADAAVPDDVAALERVLRDAGEVHAVVLGDSIAISAFDPAVLGESLPPSAAPVVDLMVHGGRAPDWYAILKNRVFGAGHRPSLVILSSNVGFFDDAPVADPDRVWAQATDDEPVLARDVFGIDPDDVWLHRRLAARVRLRDQLLDTIPWALAALPLGDRGDPRVGSDHFRVKGSIDRVLQQRGRSNAPQAGGFQLGTEGLDLPAQLGTGAMGPLLDDIVGLATGHGAQVVVLLTPFPGGAPPADLDPTRIVSGLVDVGADVLDLGGLPVPQSAFVDAVHFDPVLRPYLSQTAGKELARLVRLGARKGPGRYVPVKVRRGGADPVPVLSAAR